jgi:hypothetical protein
LTRAMNYLVVSILLMGGFSAMADLPMIPLAERITVGTRTHTGQPNGRWRIYSAARKPRVKTADKDHLWFYSGQGFWRYNVRKQTIDVHASSAQLPGMANGQLYSYNIAAGPKGQAAIATNTAMYLYNGSKWQRLPIPNREHNSRQVVFDGRGNLWSFSKTAGWEAGAYQWNPTARLWELRRPSIDAQGVIWTPQKWYLLLSGCQKRLPEQRYAQSQSAMEKWTAVERAPKEVANILQPLCRVGNQTLIPAVRGEGPCVLRFTSQGIEHAYLSSQAAYEWIDLSTGLAGGVFTQGKGPLIVRNQAGKELVRFPAPPADLLGYSTFLKDANGHIWVQSWRYDGHRWKQFLPDNAFEVFGQFNDDVCSQRYQYDPKTDRWKDMAPYSPGTQWQLRAFCAADRTGWAWSKKTKGWTKYRFDDSGPVATLAHMPDTRWSTLPQFHLAGDLWCRGTIRWDGKAHHYPNGYTGQGSSTKALPQLCKSPAGTVWRYLPKRTFQRYDPDNDKFVDGSPYDEFSFQAGGRVFSIVGTYPGPGWDDYSHIGWIHEKIDGTWKPMGLPFYQIGNGVSLRLRGMPNGRNVHNGRMILSAGRRVFEVDLATNRWAVLNEGNFPWAWFDKTGRRWMAGHHSLTIYSYQGEPFYQPVRKVSHETQAAKTEALTQAIAVQLKALNSNRWAVRKQAAKRLANLVRADWKRSIPILKPIVSDRTQPAEARAQVQYLLSLLPTLTRNEPIKIDRGSGGKIQIQSLLGNSLFERMHPQRSPVCNYVLKKGMPLEQAWSIIRAAGGRWVTGAGNRRQYSRWLLPDMTFLELHSNYTPTKGKPYREHSPNENPRRNPVRVMRIGLGRPAAGIDHVYEIRQVKTLDLSPVLHSQPASPPAKTSRSSTHNPSSYLPSP